MLVVETPADLARLVGKKLGVSDWFEISQRTIDAFAEITGDKNWFHIDVARAAREMPGGKTIAHGCLLLSLVSQLSSTIFEIKERKRGLFYGADRVRFLSPVAAGSRIRLHQTLASAEPVDGGMRFTSDCTLEIEGAPKPAMVAQMIVLAFG